MLPLAVVVAFIGLGRVLGWRLVRRLRAAGLLLAPARPGARMPPRRHAYAWGVQNINAMQVHARPLGGHPHPTRTRCIALNDLGALSYFGDRRVIDLVGLVTPEILPYRRAGRGGGAALP